LSVVGFCGQAPVTPVIVDQHVETAGVFLDLAGGGRHRSR
jgi:hypothetical protein